MDEGYIQLRWNTHQLAFLNTLSLLRDKQVYTDVTLSCGDQFYPAHRLVLSACSTFFARTLELASCKAPMLLLHGIDQDTLEQLLMFMYDGQVTILRNDLEKLVKAAQWLGVKGLDVTQDSHKGNVPSEDISSSQVMENWEHNFSSAIDSNVQSEGLKNGTDKNETSMVKKNKDSFDQSFKSESHSLEQTNQKTNTQDIPDTVITASSVENAVHDNLMENCSSAQESEDSSSSYSFTGWEQNKDVEHDAVVENNSQPNEDVSSSPAKSTRDKTSKGDSDVEENKRSLRCKHCRRAFGVRKDLARHLRTHHDQTLNYCFSCHRKFISEKEFKYHMKIHETGKLHTCSMCDFVSHSIYGLKKHVNVVHQSTCLEPVVLISKLKDSDYSDTNSEDCPRKKMKAEVPTSSTCEAIFENEISLQDHKDKDCKKRHSRANGTVPEPVVMVPKTELLNKLNNAPSVAEPEELKCFICMRVFKTKCGMRSHKEKGCKGIIKSEKGFHCPLCLFVGTRQRSTEDHLACHTGAHRFRCPHCPYQCNRNFLLKRHIHKRHPECN